MTLLALRARWVLTDDALGERGLLERGEAQVSDLDGGGGSGDEDVVTLEVSVQDGGAARVQELKTLQDLKAPTLQQLQLHLTEPAQVPEEHTGPFTPGNNIQPEGSTQV